MKKLLAIALVLGLASMANAALSLGVDPDGTTVIVSASGDMSQYIALVTLDEVVIAQPIFSGVNPTYNIITPFAPGNDVYDYELLPATYKGFAGTLSNGTNPLEGVVITAATAGYGTVELYSFGDDGSLFNKIGEVVVPEPMTMSLLALGGLVALRRRR